jgi:hypothetical protein
MTTTFNSRVRCSSFILRSIIGPVVGGAVGGVVVLGLLVLGIILYSRKKRQPAGTGPEVNEVQQQFNTGTTQNLLSPQVDHGYAPTTYTRTPYTPTPYTPAPDTTSVNSSIPLGYTPVAEMMPATDSHPGLPHGYTPVAELMPADESHQSIISNSQASTAPMLAYRNTASSVNSYPTSDTAPPPSTIASTTTRTTTTSKSSEPFFVSNPPPTTTEPTTPHSISSGGMTDEQAQFVRELRSMNVPTAEIASLIENMRREREGGGSKAQDHTTLVEAAPPRYDFKGLVCFFSFFFSFLGVDLNVVSIFSLIC